MRTTFLVAAAGLAFHASLVAQVGPWIQNQANGREYAMCGFMTWSAAEQLAGTLGGHLATIRDATEHGWLAQTFGTNMPPDARLWIGLSDATTEGTWTWTSGWPVSFTNWGGNEPDNAGGNQNAGTFWLMSSGNWAWSDYQAQNFLPGIIERESVASTYAAFGTGCPEPSGSVPSLEPVAGELPRIGTTSHLRVSNLPLALTIPVFVVGFSDSTAPAGYALPFDLAPLGWAGCEQLVSNEILYWTITTSGQADQAFAIPAAAPVGFEFFVQALILHTPTGASVSNGIAAQVGY